MQQILSDFQCRWQVAKDAGLKNAGVGLGDGWLRLMEFDMRAEIPRVHVRTYSTRYKKFSTDTPEYARWYKSSEKPGYTDEEFLAEDEFTFDLTDFRMRFQSNLRSETAQAAMGIARCSFGKGALQDNFQIGISGHARARVDKYRFVAAAVVSEGRTAVLGQIPTFRTLPSVHGCALGPAIYGRKEIVFCINKLDSR